MYKSTNLIHASELQCSGACRGFPSEESEKGVALKVGEKAASNLTPLHAPECSKIYVFPMAFGTPY